jgi:hypothetical protein
MGRLSVLRGVWWVFLICGGLCLVFVGFTVIGLGGLSWYKRRPGWVTWLETLDTRVDAFGKRLSVGRETAFLDEDNVWYHAMSALLEVGLVVGAVWLASSLPDGLDGFLILLAMLWGFLALGHVLCLLFWALPARCCPRMSDGFIFERVRVFEARLVYFLLSLFYAPAVTEAISAILDEVGRCEAEMYLLVNETSPSWALLDHPGECVCCPGNMRDLAVCSGRNWRAVVPVAPAACIVFSFIAIGVPMVVGWLLASVRKNITDAVWRLRTDERGCSEIANWVEDKPTVRDKWRVLARARPGESWLSRTGFLAEHPRILNFQKSLAACKAASLDLVRPYRFTCINFILLQFIGPIVPEILDVLSWNGVQYMEVAAFLWNAVLLIICWKV